MASTSHDDEHDSHVEDPTRLKNPTGPGLHTEEPSISENVPAGLHSNEILVLVM